VQLIVSDTAAAAAHRDGHRIGGRAAHASGAERWDQHVTVFDDGDRGAAPASGSARNRGMVICPCSMGTLSAISQGTSRSLVERAADVALKERRTLVLVPRETPYRDPPGEHAASDARRCRGAAGEPGFYHRPTEIGELVDFVVARVLDHLGVEHSIGKRWGAPTEDA
jgi:4-hydroxy-3-polyprenylbenzoate decarboxylase